MQEKKITTVKITKKDLAGLTLDEFLESYLGMAGLSNDVENGDDAEDMYIIEQE